MTEAKYLHFESAGQHWLVSTTPVQDVVELSLDAFIPGSPPFLPGLLAHRGSLLSVIRLDRLLDQTLGEICRRVVVLRHGNQQAAVAVVSAGPVMELTGPVEAELPWELPDQVAVVARGITGIPLPGSAGEGQALMLDVPTLFRRIGSSCIVHWQRSTTSKGTGPQ